jgi:GNAT superfamily N-acetyltransferase
MPLQVSLMREGDIDGAIDTIQEAFAEDPYAIWVYDRSKVLSHPFFLPCIHPTNSTNQFSPTRNRVSLTLRCHWGIKHGLFYVCKDPSSPTPEKVLGTAMWLAPSPTNTSQSWSLYLSSWWLWLNQIRMNLIYGCGGLNVKRYWLWKEAQAAAQAELWDDPRGYYFCNIVTVLPEYQGKGVGRALMEEVLERADREGMKCYLESSRKDPNVPIYEKFGFKLVRDMVCDDEGDAIMLYCMMRDPMAVTEGSVPAA